MKLRFNKSTTLALAILLAVSLLGGCASTGGGSSAPAGPPPEEQVEALLMGLLDSLKAGDVPGMMAAYTEDFTWDQGDRASMEAFMQGAADGGFLDGVTADVEGLTITVDGDTATASGISIEGAFGLLDLSFEAAKRDGKWMVTKQSQQ